MFGMVTQTLQENVRLQELREEIRHIEDEALPLQNQQTDLALKLISKVTEAWGLVLRDMFPDVPVSQESCLAEVKPTDSINKAQDLEKAVRDMGLTITRIEHDPKRNSYRLYGRKSNIKVA